jgi:hypothetical protein
LSRFTAAALAIVLGACTSFRSSSAPGDDSGGPRIIPDGSADAPEQESGLTGNPNLLPNPGFEEELGSASGCLGWTPDQATTELSTVARTGAHSCLVCALPVTAEFFNLTAPAFDADGGTSFYGEAWFKAPPARAGVVSVGTQATLSVDGTISGNQVPPDPSSWASSTFTFTTSNSGSLQFYIHSFIPDGGCVLVDDASLHRVP